MATRLYLVRNAPTVWTREKRITGRRDIGLSPEGQDEAKRVAARLAGVDVSEIVSSPLPRALETADRIAAAFGIEVDRDPRLTDFDAGAWEGQPFAEVAKTDEYKQYLQRPLETPIPGGKERLGEVRDRVVASVAQVLADNELGAHIVMVSHASPLRILIAHALGMDVATYHRIHLDPCSVSILEYEGERGVPRVLGLNHR